MKNISELSVVLRKRTSKADQGSKDDQKEAEMGWIEPILRST